MIILKMAECGGADNGLLNFSIFDILRCSFMGSKVLFEWSTYLHLGITLGLDHT